MYPVSSAYTTAVQASFRNAENIAVIVNGVGFYDGYVRGLTLRESVSENSDRLLPGCAACASIETTVVGSLPVSYIGTEMTARHGVTLADGTVEWVPLGVFIVQDIQRSPGTNVTTIIGYDRMSILDGEDFEFEELTDTSDTWSTFKTLLNSIVPLDNSGSIQWASVPDVSTLFVNRPMNELHGYNKKELLGYIAGAHGKFARFNRYGQLEFAWYSHCGLTVPSKAIFLDGLELKSLNDVSDTVHLYSNDDIEESGHGDYTNDLVSSVFAEQSSAVTSLSSPGSLRFRGDASIMAGDVITVTMRNGDTRRFSVSEHTFRYNGGVSGTIESHGLSRKTFHSLDSTRREIARLKKNYATAMPTTTEVEATTE